MLMRSITGLSGEDSGIYRQLSYSWNIAVYSCYQQTFLVLQAFTSYSLGLVSVYPGAQHLSEKWITAINEDT